LTRRDEFKTVDIELASALMTSGIRPCRIAPGENLVEFHFHNIDDVQGIALEYASGTLCLQVRKLANSRSWLYRQIREVSKTGREVLL